MNAAIIVGVTIALGLNATVLGDPGSLRGIGILPGGPGSGAIAVSADGTVVVGSSSRTFGGSEAVVWTAATGLIGLGDVNGPPTSSAAFGVAGNGSIVVGADIHEGGGSTTGGRW